MDGIAVLLLRLEPRPDRSPIVPRVAAAVRTRPGNRFGRGARTHPGLPAFARDRRGFRILRQSRPEGFLALPCCRRARRIGTAGSRLLLPRRRARQAIARRLPQACGEHVRAPRGHPRGGRAQRRRGDRARDRARARFDDRHAAPRRGQDVQPENRRRACRRGPGVSLGRLLRSAWGQQCDNAECRTTRLLQGVCPHGR